MPDRDGYATNVDRTRVPRHVAVIMDGNGRWAQARGYPRTAGHAQGEPALFDVIEGARLLGVEWLTAYTFSTENWTRSPEEVEFLMHFNADVLERRRDQLDDANTRIIFIGHLGDPRIPDVLRERIDKAQTMTRDNTGMTTVFAFNYGGRAELSEAARSIAIEAASGGVDPDDVDEKLFSAHLAVPEMPDVDLVIRSSGEHRTSNFLPWQAAYAEYVFSPVLWPDFDRDVFAECVVEYQGRERRFGRA
jgi:undecaprenyl diphosphate synthase